VNVADLAGELGGGGHARAAGAKLQAPLEEAVRRVTQIVSAAFKA
jgi:nanoRNase/pAp phosphatase (c-di-AMP/oligoRNAs hydrolase)